MDEDGCEDIFRKPSIGRQGEDFQKPVKELRPTQVGGGQPASYAPAHVPSAAASSSAPQFTSLNTIAVHSDHQTNMTETYRPSNSDAVRPTTFDPPMSEAPTTANPAQGPGPGFQIAASYPPSPSLPEIAPPSAAPPRSMIADAAGAGPLLAPPTVPAIPPAIASTSGLNTAGARRPHHRHKHARSTASSVFDDSDDSLEEQDRSARMHPNIVFAAPVPSTQQATATATTAAVASTTGDSSRRLSALPPTYRGPAEGYSAAAAAALGALSSAPSNVSSAAGPTAAAGAITSATQDNMLLPLLIQQVQILQQQQQQQQLLLLLAQQQQASATNVSDMAATFPPSTVNVGQPPGTAGATLLLPASLLGSASSVSHDGERIRDVVVPLQPLQPPPLQQQQPLQLLLEQYLSQWSQMPPMMMGPAAAAVVTTATTASPVEGIAQSSIAAAGSVTPAPSFQSSVAAAVAPVASAPLTTAAHAASPAGVTVSVPNDSETRAMSATVTKTAGDAATAVTVPGLQLPQQSSLDASISPAMPPPLATSDVRFAVPIDVPSSNSTAAAMLSSRSQTPTLSPAAFAAVVAAAPSPSQQQQEMPLQLLLPLPQQAGMGSAGELQQQQQQQQQQQPVASTPSGGGGNLAEGGKAAARVMGEGIGQDNDKRAGLPSADLVAENLVGNKNAIAIFQQDEDEEDIEPEEELAPAWYQRSAVVCFLWSVGVGIAVLVVGIILHIRYEATQDTFRWCYFFSAMPLLYYIMSYASLRVFMFLEWWFFRESLLYLANVQRSALWLLFFLVLLAWYHIVFRWAWCGNSSKFPRRCQQPAYVQATQIVWNVLLCIMLFCLANLLKAVLAKLLTTHFYRTAHFKKLKSALEKEFALQVLSRPRRTAPAERMATQHQLGGAGDGGVEQHGAWYHHLASYLNHHNHGGDGGGGAAGGGSGGGGGGSSNGVPLPTGENLAAAANTVGSANMGAGAGMTNSLTSPIPEENEEAEEEQNRLKQVADVKIPPPPQPSRVIVAVAEAATPPPASSPSPGGGATGPAAMAAPAAATPPLSPAELPLSSPPFTNANSPGIESSPQPYRLHLQLPSVLEPHISQPGSNGPASSSVAGGARMMSTGVGGRAAGESWGGSVGGTTAAPSPSGQFRRVGSDGTSVQPPRPSPPPPSPPPLRLPQPSPQQRQQQQQQQQQSLGGAMEAVRLLSLRKDSNGSRTSKVSMVKVSTRAVTGAMSDAAAGAAARGRKSSEAVTQVMATAVVMATQAKSDTAPAGKSILTTAAHQGLRHLTKAEMDKVRTTIVIKTQSALISKYTDRSDEDMAKELGRVKRFAKALFYNVLPPDSDREYLIVDDFVPFFLEDEGAGSGGGGGGGSGGGGGGGGATTEGRKLPSATSLHHLGAQPAAILKDGVAAGGGGGGTRGDGNNNNNNKGLGRLSLTLSVDPARAARQRQRAAEEAARKAFLVFDADNNGEVSRLEVKEAVVNIFNERRNMARSLADTETIVQSLEFGIGGVIHFVFAAVYLLIWGVDLLTGFSTFSATVLALTFVFGNSVKNMYESMLFLFVTHPYDVGDCILIGTDMYRVKKISLLYTDMVKSTGERMYMPNTSLITQGIINWTRSKNKSESCRLVCDVGVAWEVQEDIQAALRSYAKEHPGEFDGEPSCSFCGLADPLKAVLVCSWTYNFAPDEFSRLGPARKGMSFIVQSKAWEHRLQHNTL